MDKRILVYAAAAIVVALAAWFVYGTFAQGHYAPASKRVVVLGFDGMDARLAEKWMDEGKLPNLARLRASGTYSRIMSTTPADTPVAWTTMATGLNPGRHNVLDFLDRNPDTYMPRLALVFKNETEGQMPKVYNTKQGEPIWKTVSDSGGWSTVLNFPVTFPAEDFRGNMVSGIGTPDIRGTWGTFTLYEENMSASQTEMGGNLVQVNFSGGKSDAYLYGPKDMKTRMEIVRGKGNVTLRIGGTEYLMREGEWSDWADISFEANALVKLRGIGKFYLISAEPLELYLMPVSFDPREPFFKISTPDGYSKELAEEYGMYKTVGWADDTWALNDEAIDEAVFLQDSYRTLNFRKEELLGEMGKKPDLLISVFYQADTVQHTFYRYMDPENPKYGEMSEGEKAKYEGEVLRTYQRMDEIVGEAMDKADDNTTVIVMSDHGFNPFRNAVNLNTWLAQNGYMKKKPGADTRVYQLNNLFGEKGLFWNDVLMNESEAYSLGLGNIYINLKGRESQGVVEPEDYERVRNEIIGKLANFRDPANGKRVIARVQKREELYWGPYANNSADIIVSFNPGYRVSWQTSLGGVPPNVVEPNVKKWSGDHCTLDPGQTEGVFFINRVVKIGGEPSLMDVNPTLRELLGLPEDASLDGKSILSRDWNGSAAPEEAEAGKLPDANGYNVLLITLDATRADYLTPYNNASPANTTNLAKLAEQSFVFDNAFTAFTFTCPSHTAMMTGRYFRLPGAPKNNASFPLMLAGNGYATGASVGFGALRGNACTVSSMFKDYDVSAIAMKSGTRGETSANYTIDWLSKHRNGKFMFWLHLFDAHPPGIGASRDEKVNYARSLEYVDTQVGRVLDGLKSDGLENKTIVMVVADHGMGDDFRDIAENRLLYEPAVRVPLIVHVPGAAGAGRIEGLASTVDLAPTLAELLGLGYMQTDGKSIAGYMEGDGQSVRDEVFSSYSFSLGAQDMVRTEEWKLMRLKPRNGKESYDLFMLSADPKEKTDVAGDNAGVMAELKKRLESYDALRAGNISSIESEPEDYWNASSAWYGTGGDAPLDNETLEDLRSFGYIN